MLTALEVGLGIINKIIPNAEAKAEAKIKLLEMQQSGELKELEAKSKIIVAEASSQNKLTSAWRPITMLVFVAIIANNYLLYPYISLFWNDAPILNMPTELWDLLKLGIGGYVAGRSLEKASHALSGKFGKQ